MIRTGDLLDALDDNAYVSEQTRTLARQTVAALERLREFAEKERCEGRDGHYDLAARSWCGDCSEYCYAGEGTCLCCTLREVFA